MDKSYKKMLILDSSTGVKVTRKKLYDIKFDLVDIANNMVQLQQGLRQNPDLLLINTDMPRIDILEILNQIKDNPIAVVLFSGKGIRLIEDVACLNARLYSSYRMNKHTILFQNGDVFRKLISDKETLYQKKMEDFKNRVLNDRSDEIVNEVYRQCLQQKIMQIENTVIDVLTDLEVPKVLDGFNHLKDAVVMGIRKGDYPATYRAIFYKISRRYNIKPIQVEETIREAIKQTYNNGNIDILNEYFNNTKKKKNGIPAPIDFIRTLVLHIGNKGIDINTEDVHLLLSLDCSKR